MQRIPALDALVDIRLRYRFLLSYTARDAVAVLGQGNGGVDEMRECVKGYEDREGEGAKPLFGMVVYRRKRVLVKVVMEGTSRLIQGAFLWA